MRIRGGVRAHRVEEVVVVFPAKHPRALDHASLPGRLVVADELVAVALQRQSVVGQLLDPDGGRLAYSVSIVFPDEVRAPLVDNHSGVDHTERVLAIVAQEGLANHIVKRAVHMRRGGHTNGEHATLISRRVVEDVLVAEPVDLRTRIPRQNAPPPPPRPPVPTLTRHAHAHAGARGAWWS